MRIRLVCAAIIFLCPGIYAQEIPYSLAIHHPAALDSMEKSIKLIEAEGGRVIHIFPPHILIGHIPDKQGFGLKSIHQGEVELSQVEEYGPIAVLAVRAWNEQFKKKPAPAPPITPEPEPIADDCLIVPRQPIKGPLAAPPFGAGFYDTSEYMLGRVAVGVILPESKNQLEDWTPAEETKVCNEIINGLDWWNKLNPDAKLSFIYDYHLPSADPKVQINCEPITLPHKDERIWVNEVMNNLGFTNSGPGWAPDYFYKVYDYNNSLRDKFKTGWCFTIFVVDSSNDSRHDGRFADGKFAYAYLGGPFLIITSTSNGYGMDGLDAVVAHETGHIFYALDEYHGPSSPTERTGYLDAVNANHEDSGSKAPCIMRGQTAPFVSKSACQFTQEQVGWRDNDNDHIPEPVDTPPQLLLTPYTPTLSPDNTPTYSGSAEIAKVPNKNPQRVSRKQAINISTISYVEYRIDKGLWHQAAPADGAFDGPREDFRFTTLLLPDGTATIEVCVTDTFGNKSWATDTLVVNAVNFPPHPFQLLLPPDKSTTSDLTPFFDWEDATDPDPADIITYNLWYSKEPAFVTKTEINGLTLSEYTPITGLEDNSTYYWKVQALDVNKAVRWSDTRQFSTRLILGPLSYLKITPISATLRVGNTRNFTAQGYDANDNPIPGLSYNWGVIGNQGIVFPITGTQTTFTATTPGKGSVSVSANGVSQEAAVRVLPPARITRCEPNRGPEGTSVEIGGAGYFSNEPIQIDLGLTTGITFTTADNEGNFSTIFVVDSQTPGTKTVVATGLSSKDWDDDIFVITQIKGIMEAKIPPSGPGEAPSTPVVGDIDGDGHPEIVFGGIKSPGCGTLNIVRKYADNRVEVVGTMALGACFGPALADVDNDGRVEIVLYVFDGKKGKVMAVRADKSIAWETDLSITNYSYWGDWPPAIGDVDGDGCPDVAISLYDGKLRLINGKNGQILDTKPSGGSGHGRCAIVDLDMDGVPEVLSAYGTFYVYKWKSNQLQQWWTGRGLDLAVADLDKDLYHWPEIACVDQQGIRVYRYDGGKPIWEKSNYRLYASGPAVCDLDLDGKPEIAIGSTDSHVYALNGEDSSLLWDSGNLNVGEWDNPDITATDLNGDLVPEVTVVSDDVAVVVLEGLSGKVLLNTKIDIDENERSPVIADVDDDGHAEIVVPSGNIAGGQAKYDKNLLIFGDDENWVETRNLWNQGSYYATNIDGNLVPTTDFTPWLSHNTWRTQLPKFTQSKNGALSGTVTRSDGLTAIPGVLITVYPQGTRTISGAAFTRANGKYRIVLLPPGTYTVTASIPGYNSGTRSGIIVIAGTETTDVNFRLDRDDQGPVTRDLRVSPNPTSGAAAILLTGVVDDTFTGNSKIKQAEYFKGADPGVGNGTVPAAADGTFDEVVEDVELNIDITTWPSGTYILYVRGQDELGNWGTATSIVLSITPGTATNLVISPKPLTIPVDTSQIFEARVTDRGGRPVEDGTPVGWESTYGRVAPLTSNTCNGVAETTYTSPVLIGEGKVTATALVVGSPTDSSTVTVVAGEPAELIIVPGRAWVVAGDKRDFTGYVYDKHGNYISNLTYNWQATSKVGTIIPTGQNTTFSAGRQLGFGTVSVTTQTPQGTLAAAGDITVEIIKEGLTYITLTPGTATLQAGETCRFVAQGYDQYDNPIPDLNYTWSVQGAIGDLEPTYSRTNTLTAGKIAPETGIVEVRIGTISATARVNIIPGPLNYILVNPDPAVIEVDSRQIFIADGYDRYGNLLPGLIYDWTAPGPLGTVTPIGTFTMLNSATITATGRVSAGTMGITGSASVTLFPAPLHHIIVTPGTPTVEVGTTQDFAAQGYDRYNNPVFGHTYQWEIRPDSGSLTSIFGTTTGYQATTTPTWGTITASFGTITGYATITVIPGKLDHIIITPGIVTVEVGTTQPFIAQGYDRYGNPLYGISYQWDVRPDSGSISGSPGTSTVYQAVTVPAKGTISASFGQVTGYAAITVIPGPLHHILVTPNPAMVEAGTTQSFTAQGYDRFYNPVLGYNYQWRIPSGFGRLYPISGTSTLYQATITPTSGQIFASFGTISGYAGITVTLAELEYIVITPGTATLEVGHTRTFTAQGYNRYHQIVPGLTYRWATGNSGAVWATTGTVTTFTAGSRTGTEKITVASGTKSVAAIVTIIPGPLDHFKISPVLSPQIACQDFFIEIKAYDRYDNLLTDYIGQAKLSDTSGSISLLQTTNFKAGQWNGFVSIARAHSQVKITAGDLVQGKSGQSNYFAVVPGPLYRIVVDPPQSILLVKGSRSVTAQAYDRCDNPIPNITYNWYISSGIGDVEPVAGTSTTFTAATRPGQGVITALAGCVYGTGSIEVVPGDLDHFDFEYIPHQVGVTPFRITITARDANDNLVNFSDKANLTDLTGTIDPGSTSYFTGGTWTGTVTINAVDLDVRIFACRNDARGTSNRFACLIDDDVGTSTGRTKTRVEVNAHSLKGKDYYVKIEENPTGFAIINANLKDKADPCEHQVPGSIRSLSIVNGDEKMLDYDFGSLTTFFVPYCDKDGDGIVDGTSIIAKRLYLCILEANEWKRVESEPEVDLPGRVVSARIFRAGTYSLMGCVIQADLDKVIAFPTPFLAHQRAEKISFHGLSDGCTLRIYDLAGDLVFHQENLSGCYEWDVVNEQGKPLESGVYLYVVTDKEGEKKIGKVAIIR